MRDSKLLSLFNTLRPKERKELDEYIRLSFVQSNEAVVALYTYLQKHYDTPNVEKLQRKAVYQKALWRDL